MCIHLLFFVIHFGCGLTFSFLFGIFPPGPEVLNPSLPFSLAQHPPSLGRLLAVAREESSKGKEGIKVSDGIAGSAKLMTSGFLKAGNTKDEDSLVGMILKALEILDNTVIVWWGGAPINYISGSSTLSLQGRN